MKANENNFEKFSNLFLKNSYLKNLKSESEYIEIVNDKILTKKINDEKIEKIIVSLLKYIMILKDKNKDLKNADNSTEIWKEKLELSLSEINIKIHTKNAELTVMKNDIETNYYELKSELDKDNIHMKDIYKIDSELNDIIYLYMNNEKTEENNDNIFENIRANLKISIPIVKSSIVEQTNIFTTYLQNKFNA
jgi:hypothetical protein